MRGGVVGRVEHRILSLPTYLQAPSARKNLPFDASADVSSISQSSECQHGRNGLGKASTLAPSLDFQLASTSTANRLIYPSLLCGFHEENGVRCAVLTGQGKRWDRRIDRSRNTRGLVKRMRLPRPRTNPDLVDLRRNTLFNAAGEGEQTPNRLEDPVLTM